jgi:hypothetical protein
MNRDTADLVRQRFRLVLAVRIIDHAFDPARGELPLDAAITFRPANTAIAIQAGLSIQTT